MRKRTWKVCWSCLLWRRLNCEAADLRSSAAREKASTSVRAWTVLVEIGKCDQDWGSKAHVRRWSPQKSLALKCTTLRNPVCHPLVVALKSFPLITNTISPTGSPSRITYSSCLCRGPVLTYRIQRQIIAHPLSQTLFFFSLLFEFILFS